VGYPTGKGDRRTDTAAYGIKEMLPAGLEPATLRLQSMLTIELPRKKVGKKTIASRADM